MFKLILVKELRDLFYSNRFIMSFLLCGLLIIVGFSSASYEFHRAQSRYEASVAENRNQIAAKTDWPNVDHRISIPPNPLSTLVAGISNDQGLDVAVRSRGELTRVNTRYNDQPMLALFRVIDLDFIFGVVLSLFGIVFAFDAVNGEKQRGTLKLCFANALPRSHFILAKLLGNVLGVFLALLIPIILGVGILILTNVPLSGSDWLKLFSIILSGMLYFTTFLTVSIAFSSLTSRPSHSFLLGLLFWVASVMIIPRAAVVMAGRMVDVPSIDAINAQKAQLSADLWQKDMEELNGFKIPKTDDVGEAFKSFQKKMSDLAEKRQEKIDALGAELNRTLQNARSHQGALSLALARLSPTSLFSLAVMNLAGTSIGDQQRIQESLVNYQEQYSRFLAEKTGQQSSGFHMIIVTDQDGSDPEPLDPDELPEFSVSPLPAGESLKNAILDLFLMVSYNLAALGIAFFTFLKYDLR